MRRSRRPASCSELPHSWRHGIHWQKTSTMPKQISRSLTLRPQDRQPAHDREAACSSSAVVAHFDPALELSRSLPLSFRLKPTREEYEKDPTVGLRCRPKRQNGFGEGCRGYPAHRPDLVTAGQCGRCPQTAALPKEGERSRRARLARGFYRPLRGFQLRPRSPQAGSLLLFAARSQPEGYAVDAKSSGGEARRVGCRCKKQQAWRFDGRACTFLVRARSLRASELPVRAAKSGLSAAPSQPGRARSELRASSAGPRGREPQASGLEPSPDLVPPPPKRLAAAARRASRATPLPPALAKR